jgi:hypothetical protein
MLDYAPQTPAQRMLACLETFGVFPARGDEFTRGRAIAAELISPDVASEATFAAVHARNGAAVFVYRQDGLAQGFLGVILLRASGLAKIEADSFNAVAPDLNDVCEAGEEPVAVYGWGFAAATARASGAMVLGLMALRDRAGLDVPFFCRAATPAGAKVILGKMGYAPFEGSITGLLVRYPETDSLEVAA